MKKRAIDNWLTGDDVVDTSAWITDKYLDQTTTQISRWANQTSPQQAFLMRVVRNNANATAYTSSTTTPTISNCVITPSTVSGGVYISAPNHGVNVGPSGYAGQDQNGRVIRIADGMERTIHLPDGTKIEVQADGAYEIIDTDAKVIYRASRVKDFNPFLNASDKLEEFIRHCGTVGVRQSEVLRLPLELFVAWLIISAARQDDMEPPDLPLETKLKRQALPRCTGCGRFLARPMRERSLEFCRPRCYAVHHERALALPPPRSALIPVAKAA